MGGNLNKQLTNANSEINLHYIQNNYSYKSFMAFLALVAAIRVGLILPTLSEFSEFLVLSPS